MSDAQGGDAGENEQPAGGQAQGETPPQGNYQRGPGIGDIFSRPETINEMKVGAALYGLVTLGLGVTGFGFSLASGGMGSVGAMGGMGGGAAMGGAMGLVAGLLFVPLIALIVGVRQADVLEDQPDNLAYANAAVTGFIGTVVTFVVSLVFLLLGGGGSGLGQVIGQLLGPVIVSGIGAGIVAAGTVWVSWNVLPKRAPAPAQSDQQPR